VETVVVGVDGSEASGVALEFAVEEAVRRKARLRVVSAWVLAMSSPPEMVMAPDMVEAFQTEAQTVIDEAVARARELQPDLPCEGVVLEGDAGDLLVAESRGAAVVVVGRRGHGALQSLILGSVSRRVVDHAACPVIVVPPLTAR
jgi:nucleotide-binding universal stress UspA family protein